MVWTVHSGSVYKRVVDQYVINLYENGTQLTEVASIAAVNSAGKWFFDEDTYTVYVRATDSGNPGDKDHFTMAIYRLFLANMPIDLPYDLVSGKTVPYEGIINNTSAFGAELDSERKGTALESTGNISLFNAEGFFDGTFDRLIWEGKRVAIYLMPVAADRSPLVAQKILLFKGFVVNKSFSAFEATFEVSDFIFKLREEVNLPKYTSADFAAGEANSELLPADGSEGAHKKRAYGRVAGMQMHSAQKVEDVGLKLAGTFSSLASSVDINISTTVAGGGGNNEIQLIEFDPTDPQGGTFTLTFSGQTTADMPYNTNAAFVQEVLEALSNIGAGQVSVSGSVGSGFTVEFIGTLANTDVAQMTATSSLSKYALNYIQGTTSDIHSEISPGDELVALGGTTYSDRSDITSITIDTLSRIDIAANSQMTVDFFDNTTYLQIEGVSSEFDTSKLAAGDFIVIKGRNVNSDNRGVWEVSSIPAPGTINLTRAAGDGGTTETNVVINDGATGYDIIAIRGSASEIITLAGELDGAFTNKALWVVPNTASTQKNRKFFGTHHACSVVTATITVVDAPNQRVTVADSTGLREDDYVLLTGDFEVKIRNINGNVITFERVEDTDDSITTVLGSINVSDTVTRPSIQELWHSKQDPDNKKVFFARLRSGRDFTVTNNSSAGLYVTLNEDAEFLTSSTADMTQQPYWTNGSRVVYSLNGGFLGLRTNANVAGSRAFLSADDGVTWYQIEEVVDSQLVILREAFSGSSNNYATKIRNPEYVTDSSIISADLYGITFNGQPSGDFVETAADVVKHVLEEASLEDSLNTTSFTDANVDAPFLVSLLLPVPGNNTSSSRRDVITLMNDTIFGSLFNNIDFEISYKVLTAQRGEDIVIKLNDADILDWDINVYSDRIIAQAEASYQHGDVDKTSLKTPFSLLETFTNDDVVSAKQSNENLELNIYLYKAADAQSMAQRYAFINSTSASVITVRTKLQTIDLALNDLVQVSLDRLYKRFGSSSSRVRIGVVNSIKKTESGVSLTLDDLGNIFIRAGAVSVDSVGDWASLTDDERAYGLWITNDEGIIANDPETAGLNLIS